MGSINKLEGVHIRKGKYVLDKVYKGERIYKTLGPVESVTKSDAETALTAEKYRIDNPAKENEIPNIEIDSSSLTIEDALDYLWEHRLKHKNYAKDIKHILSNVTKRLGSFLIKDVKKSHIQNYIRLRLKDKKQNNVKGTISRRTVQKELQHLNMALNLLVDDDHLDKNHLRKFTKVEQVRKRPIILDDGVPNGPQWQLLEKHIASSIKPILITLYETGMRPIEVFNMKWYWLEKKGEGQWMINVPAEETIEGDVVFEEKTHTQREVPVSPKLLSIFEKMGIKENSSLVFPAPRKGGVRGDIESAFTNALINADLKGKGISPYALRRTRLTIWDRIDPTAGMYAAGHVSKDVHYRNYVDVTPDRLFKLVGIDYKTEAHKSNSRQLASDGTKAV